MSLSKEMVCFVGEFQSFYNLKNPTIGIYPGNHFKDSALKRFGGGGGGGGVGKVNVFRHNIFQPKFDLFN